MQSDVIFSFQYPECGTASLEFNLIQEQRAYHRQMALLMLFWFHVTVFSPDIGQDQNVTGTMLMCFKRRGVGVHNPSFGLLAHANTLCKFFCNKTCIIWFHIRVSATIVVRCLKWLINMSLINSYISKPHSLHQKRSIYGHTSDFPMPVRDGQMWIFSLRSTCRHLTTGMHVRQRERYPEAIQSMSSPVRDGRTHLQRLSPGDKTPNGGVAWTGVWKINKEP